MTVSDIITEVRAIIQQTNPNNSNISNSTILGYINACTLQLISNLVTLPKSSLTGITLDDTITLSQDMLKLDFVSVVNPTTGKHERLETMDFVNFVRLFPYYEDQPDGQPSHLVRMSDTVWMVYPAPDTQWTGAAMTLIGSVRPTELVNDTDTPPLSIAIHPVYPHFCAWKAFLALNNPERAAQEYSLYDGLRKLHMQTATSTTGSLLQFKLRGK